MTEILPWLISGLSILSTILQGNLWKNVWLLNFGVQIIYLIWIFETQNYGFLPLTIVLMVLYIRNHFKWSKNEHNRS